MQSVVISGGGIAGLSLALALRQGCGPKLDIILADPALASANFRRKNPEPRAYAVSAAASRMLEALGVWPEIAATAQPITRMIITDSRTRDVVRPVFLSFDGNGASADEGDLESRPFAHMIESDVLSQALHGACEAGAVTLLPVAVRSAAADAQGCTVQFDDGTTRRAGLVVAADGARSKLRARSGIGWVGWDYRQSGIVATIWHTRDHGGQAVEHFLPAGPFAILPLKAVAGRHRSSIVWTEATSDVEALLSLEARDLMIEIERRFGLQLGDLELAAPPRAWSLAFGIARSFAAERLALMGDAAHVIHPIAGQGLNLGLKDAAALAQVVVDAARLGLDIGSGPVLADYERMRRADTVAMGVVTDGLNRLFSNDRTPVRLARDLGLGLVERLPALKRFFMRQASGEAAGAAMLGAASSTPRLLRGEAL
jgi:2-octaprenyl-6-methoxyphenol hydroxylase